MRLVTYFFLTFIVTWSLWYTATQIQPELRMYLFLLGTFTPGIIALILTGLSEGRAGIAALLRRLIDWDVPARWYVFAISFMALVKLFVALLHRMLMGAWPRFGDEAWYLMIAATLISLVVGGQAGEELGWRGYALPRMAARLGFGTASVLLGMIWAAWHLPLFFFRASDTFHQSFPVYFLQVTAVSVALAWLYFNTRGSLLLVMLLHAAVNNTKDIVPSAELTATNPWAMSHSIVAWLTVIVLWACAAFFLLRMRGQPPGLKVTI